MSSWQIHHSRAEEHTIQGERFLTAGFTTAARDAFRQAAELELHALATLPNGKPRTYGALALSAVALFHKAERHDDCIRHANAALEVPGLEPYVYEELTQFVADSDAKTDPAKSQQPSDIRLASFTPDDIVKNPDAAWASAMREVSVLIKRNDMRLALSKTGEQDIIETFDWDDFLRDERISSKVYSIVGDRGERVGLRRGDDTLVMTLFSKLEEFEWVVRTAKFTVTRSPGITELRL